MFPLSGQVWRQQREEAAAQLQRRPGVLWQPGAGEDPGQRLCAFLTRVRAAAQLEQRAERPLPVQPARLHDELQQHAPVRGVKEDSALGPGRAAVVDVAVRRCASRPTTSETDASAAGSERWRTRRVDHTGGVTFPTLLRLKKKTKKTPKSSCVVIFFIY